VAGVKDHNWQLFCGKIGADALAVDERFSENALRTKHYSELEPLMFEATRKRTKAEWIRELGEHFLVGPLNNIAEMTADPQVNHRNMIVELPTWTGGTLKVSNTPVKHSRTPGGAERGAAKPGEHSIEILEAVGFSDDEVQRLVEQGVVAVEPVE
jgi:crotonobetainyl-CoA:carnitine CoA-transferase CaiB-like acyl-CoA transferase